jgi:hypothetical protein
VARELRRAGSGGRPPIERSEGYEPSSSPTQCNVLWATVTPAYRHTYYSSRGSKHDRNLGFQIRDCHDGRASLRWHRGRLEKRWGKEVATWLEQAEASCGCPWGETIKIRLLMVRAQGIGWCAVREKLPIMAVSIPTIGVSDWGPSSRWDVAC